jgi:methanogenic corrinoid protein MtbC1
MSFKPYVKTRDKKFKDMIGNVSTKTGVVKRRRVIMDQLAEEEYKQAVKEFSKNGYKDNMEDARGGAVRR